MNGKGPQCALSFELFVVVTSLVVLVIVLLLLRAYLASKNVKMCCDCYLRWVLNQKRKKKFGQGVMMAEFSKTKVNINSSWICSKELYAEISESSLSEWSKDDDQGIYEIAELVDNVSLPLSTVLRAKICHLFNAGGVRGYKNKKYELAKVAIIQNVQLQKLFEEQIYRMEERARKSPFKMNRAALMESRKNDGCLEHHFPTTDRLEHAT